MSIDYNKVKNHISTSMPDRYINGKTVLIRYLDGPCPDNKLNWIPWKNDGEILPVKYLFYWPCDGKTTDDKPIKMPKGYAWFIKYLSDSHRKDNPDVLPAAFIYLFTRDTLDRVEYDIKSDLGISARDLHSLCELSRNELLENGYSIPDSHCKKFMDINLEEILCLMSGKKRGGKLLADIILSSVENMTTRYMLVEERYSNEEYERIEALKEERYRKVTNHVSNAWAKYKNLESTNE